MNIDTVSCRNVDNAVPSLGITSICEWIYVSFVRYESVLMDSSLFCLSVKVR
jgi:hypothetical protein